MRHFASTRRMILILPVGHWPNYSEPPRVKTKPKIMSAVRFPLCMVVKVVAFMNKETNKMQIKILIFGHWVILGRAKWFRRRRIALCWVHRIRPLYTRNIGLQKKWHRSTHVKHTHRTQLEGRGEWGWGQGDPFTPRVINLKFPLHSPEI